MLTIEQRRELLQNWYDKFGLDSLLDKCAIDLHSFAHRCYTLRCRAEYLENSAADLASATLVDALVQAALAAQRKITGSSGDEDTQILDKMQQAILEVTSRD